MVCCGDELKRLRGEKTQREVAAELNISPSAWAMYEKNERIPRDALKVKIAKMFGKSVQEIFYAKEVTS